MGSDIFEISVNLVKLLVIFLAMVQAVPLLVWVERRGSAFIQFRFGPNRVGPLGLTQLLADAVKFIFKEEFVPQKAVAFLYYAAPVAALVPASLALASIPFGAPIEIDKLEMAGRTWGPYVFEIQGFHMNVGIIYILGVSSLGAYGLLMAGWGSANKYSLMGALRASAQMISYELALGLSIVAIVLSYGTFDLSEMVAQQSGPLQFHFWGSLYEIQYLPNWGIFFQPLGFILLFTSVFAESNRLPFDLPESEGELVAGFHTEYGGFKMLLFFMGEYGHMIVASALISIFYMGGYELPTFFGLDLSLYVKELVRSFDIGANLQSILISVAGLTWMLLKVVFFLWVFIWVRWTLPRFRYDHLMDLGWKTMLPWAIFNVIATAFMLLVGQGL
jgi:NADH-quinone oxidoreductase subunit H